MFKDKYAEYSSEDFLKSKFDYFWKSSYGVVIIGAAFSFLFYLTDCLAFGGFPLKPLIARISVVIPLVLFIVINKKVTNWKVLLASGYAVLFCITWSIIWALSYRDSKFHANEGFMIMHVLFLGIEICSPLKKSIIAHFAFFATIVLSNFFMHYEAFSLLLIMNPFCIIGILLFQWIMEKAYMDQYKTRNTLITMTTLDNLTKAYNRNKLGDILSDDEKKLLGDFSQNAGILMVDVDHFKHVNDEYGHEDGDKVLIFVANTIRSCVRRSDYVIRWGGEEFVVILQGASPAVSANIGEKIRNNIEKSDSSVCPVTVSVGVSFYTDGDDFNEIVKKADWAMYMAKESGRNKVCSQFI